MKYESLDEAVRHDSLAAAIYKKHNGNWSGMALREGFLTALEIIEQLKLRIYELHESQGPPPIILNISKEQAEEITRDFKPGSVIRLERE